MSIATAGTGNVDPPERDLLRRRAGHRSGRRRRHPQFRRRSAQRSQRLPELPGHHGRFERGWHDDRLRHFQQHSEYNIYARLLHALVAQCVGLRRRPARTRIGIRHDRPSGNLTARQASHSRSQHLPTGAQFVTATATDLGGNTSEFSQEFGTDQPPTARIGFATLTVNEGEPVSFDGTGSTSPSGDPLSYSWTFGDGRAATGADPTHTYLSTGTDTVTLTVDDGFGGISTAHATIVVVDVPPVFTPDSFTPPETYTTATAGNGFGAAVASVDGNVAIGAPLASSTGAGLPLRRHSHRRRRLFDLCLRRAHPHLRRSAAASGDQFGASIAVVGNELIVGAPGSGLSGSGNGAAYVFDANPDSTTFGQLLATLTIPSPVVGTGAQFGAAVGTTNTNIVIGAPGTSGGQGEAYEFEGDTTQSNFGALLLAIPNPDPNALPLSGSQFGAAVGGLGDDMIVGAPQGGSPSNPTLGKVYLFDGISGAELTQISNPHPARSGLARQSRRSGRTS